MGSAIYVLVLIAVALQIIGTAILGLFSFYGLKVEVSNKLFSAGKPLAHVTVVKRWIYAARVGLVMLLVGIGMGGFATIATL